MTRVSKEVVKRLIREAEEALDEIKSVISMELDEFVSSRRARFSLRYSIVLIVEALADLGVAILEKDFNEEVESYRDAFIKLAEKGVISSECMQSMIKLVSLRNIVVHRYWTIDDIRIYKNAKGDGVKALRNLISEVTRYVEAENS